MAKDRLESQLPLALAGLACVFAEILLEVRPDLGGLLRKSAAKYARRASDANNADFELAAATLATLSRALHDQSLFPR